MFGIISSGANAYSKVAVETGVVAASPHKLIVMLFDGALMALSNAQTQMKNGDVAAKGQSISKAISIIESGLRASLDKKVGGEIALNLDALYEYMSHQLLLANLNNDLLKLKEVHELLQGLKSAWISIEPNAASAESHQQQLEPVLDPLAPRMTSFAKA
ncbi:flagellar export chaperone FliS [Oxalobacteraceae bacterium R-40]|uniref:Flagellar secretion chaperone FliS n=1 Tax=Keguizhuia sedimenti TaxID=3064264 RepID=A0ABU1BS27_9BURK|nr:flagellar export chaperone FliS [Oxalobacteraceae bacterium R-40]